MEANEVMIGDWVYRPDCFDQVKEIRQNGIIGLDSARGLIPFSQLEPIPLIPEILEKNGFEFIVFNEDWKKEYTYNSEDTYVSVMSIEGAILVKMETKSKEHIGVNNLHSCDIKYIHELQQALRLSKIRKEIEL